MKLFSNRQRSIRAFTLVDLLSLIIIAIVAISLCNAGFDMLREKAKGSRLRADIQSLNYAVYLFRASGGDLSDALTPEQVIAKMRAVESDRLTLTVNSVMTTGLKPVFQSSSEARTDANRAFWNAEAQSFEIKRDGTRGIKFFDEEI